MNAIVVVIDGLGASHIGPYGNSWLDTPNFNRLAAESLLLDTLYADSNELSAIYRSYMTAQHVLGVNEKDAVSQTDVTLAQRLSDSGINSILISDSNEVLQNESLQQFGQRIELPFQTPTALATSEAETRIAQVFLELLDQAANAQQPYLLWAHCSGMAETWDAPLANRMQFADEEDPEPSATVTPPNHDLEENFDPDDVLPFVHAHAGQVDVVDTCLGMLLDNLPHLDAAEDTLVVVTSPRGFALGEHRHVGQKGDLYSELLHVPCFLRYPKSQRATSQHSTSQHSTSQHSTSQLGMQRCNHLVQPADLSATLLDWFGALSPQQNWGRSIPKLIASETDDSQQLAAAANENESLLLTKAWLWKQRKGKQTPGEKQNELASELYTKPDDRWEVNEVADRCPEIIEQMEATFHAFKSAAESKTRADLPQLDEILYDTFR